MFVPKPAQYISFEQISIIILSRVGGAVSASRTFDITIQLKNGAGEHQFSNINREEQKPLQAFFDAKKLPVRDEMVEEQAQLLQRALEDADMESEDEDEADGANVVGPRPDRGSADEDEESVDEDFQTGSESDVAEEYDSAHESSGSGSDEDMPDAEDEGRRGKEGGERAMKSGGKAMVVEGRRRKKARTGK